MTFEIIVLIVQTLKVEVGWATNISQINQDFNNLSYSSLEVLAGCSFSDVEVSVPLSLELMR